MKNLFCVLSLMMVISACNQGSSVPQHKTPDENSAGKNSISYVCPMDTDVVKNKPGVCPKCGMKLIER